MPLRDSHIASIAARGGGWVGERVHMPAWAVDQAVSALGPHLPPEHRGRFDTFFSLIFVHTVDMELARCEAVADWESTRPTTPAKTGRRPPKGLPARLLRRLQALHETYAQIVARGAGTAEIAQFLKDLRADRELFWNMNLAVTESSGQHLALFWKESYQKRLFDALGPAFQIGEKQLAGALRRGATEPALEQMTRALAALYFDVTGEPPGRVWQDLSDDPEQGPFLALCRVMARAVNQSLPAELQRTVSPSMTKTVRRMVKELKEELESVLQP